MPAKFYLHYRLFVVAVRNLGITSTTEYRARYKEDSKLCSSPNIYYAEDGWCGWGSVWASKIQPYDTYEEFIKGIRKLGIKSTAQYWLRYKEDPRLPDHPSILYEEKGWSGWSAVWA